MAYAEYTVSHGLVAAAGLIALSALVSGAVLAAALLYGTAPVLAACGLLGASVAAARGGVAARGAASFRALTARARHTVLLVALDTVGWLRGCYGSLSRLLEAYLLMHGDPLGWRNTLFAWRGRSVSVEINAVAVTVRAFRVLSPQLLETTPMPGFAARGVQAFRVLSPGRALPSGARGQCAAVWLYRGHPDPEKEDWQHCAGLYGGPDPQANGPCDPPVHTLDLYGTEGALGVSIVVKLHDCGPFPMMRDLTVRCYGHDDITVVSDAAGLGGYAPEAMIRDALIAWKTATES